MLKMELFYEVSCCSSVVWGLVLEKLPVLLVEVELSFFLLLEGLPEIFQQEAENLG